MLGIGEKRERERERERKRAGGGRAYFFDSKDRYRPRGWLVDKPGRWTGETNFECLLGTLLGRFDKVGQLGRPVQQALQKAAGSISKVPVALTVTIAMKVANDESQPKHGEQPKTEMFQ